MTMTMTEVDLRPMLHKRPAVAIRLNISVRLLDELIATKQIVSVKIGKRRLISEDAIQNFIKRAERSQ